MFHRSWNLFQTDYVSIFLFVCLFFCLMKTVGSTWTRNWTIHPCKKIVRYGLPFFTHVHFFMFAIWLPNGNVKKTFTLIFINSQMYSICWASFKARTVFNILYYCNNAYFYQWFAPCTIFTNCTCFWCV